MGWWHRMPLRTRQTIVLSGLIAFYAIGVYVLMGAGG